MTPPVLRLSAENAAASLPDFPLRATGPAPSPFLFLVHAEDLAGEWERAAPSVLGEEQQARAARFHSPRDRDTYVITHFALRLVLGRFLGVAPAAVPFTRQACPGCGEPHGRPGVAGDPLYFSLSHSGHLGLVAIAATPVGADLEAIASAKSVAMLTPRLHPAERAELDRLPEAERQRAFTRVWCRKEAYLKGIGTGLSRPLSADYVSATHEPSAPADWQITDVPLLAGSLAAIALRCPVARSRHSVPCPTTSGGLMPPLTPDTAPRPHIAGGDR